MMLRRKRKPTWWLLYLLVAVVFGVGGIEMHRAFSADGGRMLELLIVLITYAFISFWLRANTGAIIHEDLERWREISRRK
jgi:hypothetical protein